MGVVFSAAFAHLPSFTQGVPVMVQPALNQQQFHEMGLKMIAAQGGIFGWVAPSATIIEALAGINMMKGAAE